MINVQCRLRNPCFGWMVLSALLLSVVHAVANDASAYLQYFGEKDRDDVALFGEEHPRLMEEWLDLYTLQLKLRELTTIFGVEKRREAKRVIPGLKREIERARRNYEKEYEDIFEEYEDERMELKEDQFGLEEKMGWGNDNARVREKLKARLQELRKKIVFYEEKLEVLHTIEAKINDTEETPGASTMYRIDERTFERYQDRFPDVLEACNTVKDYYADIDRLKSLIEEKGETYRRTRQLDILKQGLQQAEKDMKEAIQDAKDDFARDVEDAKEDIEDLNEDIASREERGRSATEERLERDQIAERLESIKEMFKFLDDMAAGAKPKKPK
ncbi:MAG: hypothetical protein K9M45_04565 [Kiritimatiellales bacterium]|nr:hypothetical protein [Kiritimatiellales bacterium]